jgi:hypothetical protein
MSNEVIKNLGGRPLKYDDPILFAKLCDEYFELMIEKEKPFTLSGLCVHLQIGKDAFYRYANIDRFQESVKQARRKIEDYTESYLFSGKNPAGAIFSLKNNYGWVDKQEVVTTNTNINSGLDLSGLSIDELKQLIASTESKLIEADYSETDE